MQSTKRLILSFAVLFTGIWAMAASQQGDFSTYRVLKPLTTILIILIALFSLTKENKIYNRYITIALCFCLLGDVLLLYDEYFLFGLTSFLVAHIFFTYACSTIYGFSRNFWSLLVLSSVYVAYFFYLKSDLKAYMLPVAVYMVAIIVMNWQAVALYLRDNKNTYLLIAFAALLFTLSDSMIAYHKFKAPFRLADFFILSTYWLAIYMFAFTSYFIKDKLVQK